MVIFHYHWLVLQPIGVLGIPGRWWWPGILALTMEWPPCSTSICVIFWGVNPHFCGWMMLDVSMVYLSKKKNWAIKSSFLWSLKGAIEIRTKSLQTGHQNGAGPWPPFNPQIRTTRPCANSLLIGNKPLPCADRGGSPKQCQVIGAMGVSHGRSASSHGCFRLA